MSAEIMTKTELAESMETCLVNLPLNLKFINRKNVNELNDLKKNIDKVLEMSKIGNKRPPHKSGEVISCTEFEISIMFNLGEDILSVKEIVERLSKDNDFLKKLKEADLDTLDVHGDETNKPFWMRKINPILHGMVKKDLLFKDGSKYGAIL